MKFYETDDFKEQQKKWYEIIKLMGFKDIEKTIGNEQKLLQYSKCGKLTDNEKLSYYQILTHYVNTQLFDCEIEEIVMFMRADGIKIKDISEELKNRGLERYHRETIRYMIRKYEVRWGIKHYDRYQMSFTRRKQPKQTENG